MTGCGSACNMHVLMSGGSGIGCGGACPVAFGGYGKKKKKCICKTKITSSSKKNTTKNKRTSQK